MSIILNKLSDFKNIIHNKKIDSETKIFIKNTLKERSPIIIILETDDLDKPSLAALNIDYPLFSNDFENEYSVPKSDDYSVIILKNNKNENLFMVLPSWMRKYAIRTKKVKYNDGECESCIY